MGGNPRVLGRENSRIVCSAAVCPLTQAWVKIPIKLCSFPVDYKVCPQ
jgi:hypothetical protein